MTDNKRVIYTFEGYRLDTGSRSLWLRGELVALPPKSLDLLLVLVEKAQTVVSRVEILDSVWPETFVEEGNINYTISHLRKVLVPSDIIKTVPRRGYYLNTEVSLFEEETEDQDVTASSSGRNARSFVHGYRWLAVTLIALMVFLAVSMEIPLRGLHFVAAPPAVRNIKTIAVLPFTEKTSAETETERSALMTWAVVGRLELMRGVNVRPLETVEGRNEPSDPIEAGRSLGADAIVSGKIVDEEASTVISLTITDVRDGTGIWEDRIVLKDGDGADINGEISFRIATALMTQMSEANRRSLGKRYTENPEAYAFYVRGRAIFERPRPGVFEEVLNNYNKAISLDPTFALAYAGLADLFFRRGNALEGDASIKAYRSGEIFAQRAFDLDPELSQSNTAMGRVYRQMRRDWTSAEDSFRRAIDLNPNNVFAHGYLAQIRILRGEPNEAIKLTNRIAEIDPTSNAIVFTRFRGFESLREHEKGLEFAEQAYALDKQAVYARISYAKFLYYTGQFDQMAEVVAGGFEEHKNFSFIWHQLLAGKAFRSGDMPLLSHHLAELMKGSANSTKYMYWLSVVYSEMGLADQAFEALEKCLENREAWMVWMNSEPGFDNIRNDPRFRELLGRMNL